MDGKANTWQVSAKHLRDVAHMHLALGGRIGYFKASSDIERRFSGNPGSGVFDQTMLDSEIDVDVIGDGSSLFTALDNPQSFSVTDEGWNAAAAVTLYARNNLGFTINYDYTDVGASKKKAYGAAVEWFVTRSVSVALSYTDFDFDNDKNRSDAIALRIGGRF